MPPGVGYGEKHPPRLTISLDFLTPNRRGSKSKKYGDDEDDENEKMSYAELARKRLAKRRKK